MITTQVDSLITVSQFDDGYDLLIKLGQIAKLRDMIYHLFMGKCISCKRPATDVNEIIPRSRSKDAVSNWKNRVTLCQDCHNDYHKDGVTDEKIGEMQILRKSYLVSIGRGEFQ